MKRAPWVGALLTIVSETIAVTFVNAADTVVFPVTWIVQERPLHAPAKPVNCVSRPRGGSVASASRVTTVPAANRALHVRGQSIPAGFERITPFDEPVIDTATTTFAFGLDDGDAAPALAEGDASPLAVGDGESASDGVGEATPVPLETQPPTTSRATATVVAAAAPRIRFLLVSIS